MSLEGTALIERKDANKEFYGQAIPALDLLTGKVPAPEAASAMYEVIEAVRFYSFRLILFPQASRYDSIALTDPRLISRLITQAEQVDESGVPQEAYIPSTQPGGQAGEQRFAIRLSALSISRTAQYLTSNPPQRNPKAPVTAYNLSGDAAAGKFDLPWL